MSLEDKDFGKIISGNSRTTHTVVRCGDCVGIGFRDTKEYIDGRCVELTNAKCKRCNGDGRLIQVDKDITIFLTKFNKSVPYVDYAEELEPFLNETKTVYYRFSLYDKNLESKYPELAALSEKYNDLAEKCQLIELLKKEEGK